MPQYAQGIALDKACMLIALDRVLEPDEWDRDFIHDYFLEFGDNGFKQEHFYLIEESAPLQQLPNGRYQVAYQQGDDYIRIINHDTLTRYRLAANRKLIYVYIVDDKTSHAVGIFADELSFYIWHTTFDTLFLPTNGLIVDRVRALE